MLVVFFFKNTLFNKKTTAFVFSLYLLGKGTYLHKTFSKRSWVNVHFMS